MTSYNHRSVNRFVGWKYDGTKGTVNWEKRKTESFFLLTLIFLKQFLFKKNIGENSRSLVGGEGSL